MQRRGPRWESDYTEFVTVHSARLRRQAYLQCGDWVLADAALAGVLRALYRGWPELGGETPEDFVEQRMRDQRRRSAGPVEASADDPAPAPTVEVAALIVRERRRRARIRLVGALVGLVTVVSAAAGLAVLRPAPGGGPIPELSDCMSEVPRSGLPRSAGAILPGGGLSGSAPSPIREAGPEDGVDRLLTVAGTIPLPGSMAVPAGVAPSRAERMSCALADLIMKLVNPSAIEPIDLGLGFAQARPLWPQPDPAYGTALTTSVLLMTPSGISTATVTVAQTTFLPPAGHCHRLAFCQTSDRGDQGQTIEQYGVRDSPGAAGGFALGPGASWWAMLVYTGHTLISLTITNTPDVRAALPASQRASPLSPQGARLAADPRLALFDPAGGIG